jgi:hypothetical protein
VFASANAVLVELARQAEVGEIGVLALVEEHVGGLDVPVHQPSGVGGLQGGRDLTADRQRAGRIERSFGAKKRPEVGSLDISHREVEPIADVAGVVDRHHVRMLE